MDRGADSWYQSKSEAYHFSLWENEMKGEWGEDEEECSV